MAPSNKRRKLTNSSSMPEISFDGAAREEYLTGFHKRKQARIKHAQEIAVKKEREERIRDRAALRKRRRDELEAHVNAVDLAVREVNARMGIDDDDEEEGNGSEQAWEGFAEVAEVDGEEEYVDEERYTTVTVETVDITKDGFAQPGADDVEDGVQEDDDASRRRRSTKPVPSSQQAVVVKDAAKNGKVKPKKKKKKFRYENKEERKVSRVQQKGKNSLQAQKRKKKI